MRLFVQVIEDREFCSVRDTAREPKPGSKNIRRKRSGDTQSQPLPRSGTLTCTTHAGGGPGLARENKSRRGEQNGQQAAGNAEVSLLRVARYGGTTLHAMGKAGPLETLIGSGRVMRAARYQARTSRTKRGHRAVLSTLYKHKYRYEATQHTLTHSLYHTRPPETLFTNLTFPGLVRNSFSFLSTFPEGEGGI